MCPSESHEIQCIFHGTPIGLLYTMLLIYSRDVAFAIVA